MNSNKVGRPKLADKELIKDSWCKIASCMTVSLVMVVCLIGIITVRTPWQVLSFQMPNNVSMLNFTASANNFNTKTKENNNVRIIPAKKTIKRVISADGTIKKIIPANSSLND